MTKEEAKEFMKKGIKMTHILFDDEEWVTNLPNGDILLEDGVQCEPSEFWKWRTDKAWDINWTVFH